jgi:hypothetical protein
MNLQPLHFIDEPIEVIFDRPPMLEKAPLCPDGFVWQGRTYRVVEPLEEWRDYTRKGHLESNMRPGHAAAAAIRGSWGVGRFFFRVRVDSGQIFELCYDRSPRPVARREAGEATDTSKRSQQRKGTWFLRSELTDGT